MNAFRTFVAAALLAPALALASGFEVINVNPRDLALSFSAVAAQQDAAATFSNWSPASKGTSVSMFSIFRLAKRWVYFRIRCSLPPA